MTVPCYPMPGPSAVAGAVGRRHASHVHHARHGIGGHGHGAIHHAPVQHLPVYGPPPPTVAAGCVRVPGALPALPGGKVFGTGVTSGGAAAAGGVVAGGAVAGGGWGLGQAAMIAAGLGLAAAGASALLPARSSAPVQTGESPARSSVIAPPTDGTAPGLPASYVPIPPLPDSSSPGDVPDKVTNAPGVGPEPDKKEVSPPAPAKPTPVPEPGTVYLLAVGVLAGLGGHWYLRSRVHR